MARLGFISIADRATGRYSPCVHKTTVTIDLEELHKAEGNLGTHGFKETINCALVEVNRRMALERAVRYLEAGQDSVPDWNTLQAWRRVKL